jgi:hypothetical protein
VIVACPHDSERDCVSSLRYAAKEQGGKWERGTGQCPPTDKKEARSGEARGMGIPEEAGDRQLGGLFWLNNGTDG